jgi:hypothetical protein
MQLSFKADGRAGRTRLLALCWAGFVLLFFTFSTTQEYYSMPCYPALALLIGSAMTTGSVWISRGTRALSLIAGCVAVVLTAILLLVRNLATPGDITAALSQHPDAYTLALGHMEDLTLASFAYLRVPLAIAAAACLAGAIGTAAMRPPRAFAAAALMMVLFIQAARLALVVFDPYLSSRPLVEALRERPPGTLIVDHHYYTFSSVFFYTGRTALLLNGRFQNLEYGAAAPDAPGVFIDDTDFAKRWVQPSRYYVFATVSALPRLEQLAGTAPFAVIATSGGKFVATNQTIETSPGHD